MTTTKTRATPQHTRIVQDVRKKYGSVIDLKATPGVLIEILRNYAPHFSPSDGTGGVSAAPPPKPEISTVAVGIDAGTVKPATVKPGGKERGDVQNADILKTVLVLQKQIGAIDKRLTQLTPPKTAGAAKRNVARR